MHTKDSIRQLLLSNNRAVERAVLAIYARQTASEQRTEDTTESNGVGYSSAHAKVMSYYARWLQGGRHLTGKHLDNARNISLRYTRQLMEIANERAVVTQATQQAVAAPVVAADDTQRKAALQGAW